MPLLRMVRGWFGTPATRLVNKPLLFLHIPKTAGCSVNNFLVNRFGVNDFHSIYPGNRIDLRTMIPNKPMKGYAGHLWYDVTNYLPPKLTVFTILREPVDRALSAYFYFKRAPQEGSLRYTPELSDVKHMELGDFIRRFPKVALSAFGNYQTYYMSRRYTSDEVELERPCARADLSKAKDNLAKCLVGVTDRLQDSLALLCHEYGWPCPDRVAEVNRTQRLPQSLDAEAQAWLEENTALDAELFRFGRELFEQRWSEYTRRHAAPPQDGARRDYRLTFDQPIPGHGWHPREESLGRHYCFSEPGAWLECPAPKSESLVVEIDTLPFLPAEVAGAFSLRVNGEPVELHAESQGREVRYRGRVREGRAGGTVRLDFHLENPVRPREVIPGSEDDRLMGPAVCEVRLRAA
jgi:hypothetical protein